MTAPKTASSAPPTTSTPSTTDRQDDSSAGKQLQTSQGKTSIADSVVQKIAGVAARDVSGVYKLGAGAARAFGAIRERIPGSGGPNVSQGVAVEVGETQAAIDLDLVVEYGVSITELAAAVRRNVIQSIERMTGLQVVEVNISVDDIHLPSDPSEDEQPQESRVQ